MVKNTIQCLANDDWNTFFTSTYSRWITCSTSTLSTSSVAITWNTSCAICISYTITLSTSITVRRSTICIGNHTVASYWNISIFVQKTFMAFKASFKIEQILTYTIWSIRIPSIIVIPCRTGIAHHTLISGGTIWNIYIMWPIILLFYHDTKYLPHWPSLPQLPLFPFVPPVWHPQAAMINYHDSIQSIQKHNQW